MKWRKARNLFIWHLTSKRVIKEKLIHIKRREKSIKIKASTHNLEIYNNKDTNLNNKGKYICIYITHSHKLYIYDREH